jgi:hypothetical protein
LGTGQAASRDLRPGLFIKNVMLALKKSYFGWFATIMCILSLYSITARRILLPLARFVSFKMNISFIAFGIVDFLAAFGITFVLTI